MGAVGCTDHRRGAFLRLARADARAVNLDSPVTRPWLGLSAARVHIGNDPAPALTMLDGALLQPA
jgi:hypothetical protein